MKISKFVPHIIILVYLADLPSWYKCNGNRVFLRSKTESTYIIMHIRLAYVYFGMFNYFLDI